MKTLLIAFFTALLLFADLSQAVAQNTEMMYQGRLFDGVNEFTGTGHFQFALVTGTNIAETATAAANPPSGGFITVINVTFSGYGYTNAPAVTISGGDGSGATATATVSGGAVTAVTVKHAGSNYTSTPNVTVAGPPADIAYTSYWSNDETSTNGSEPALSLNLTVSNGLFSVILGDVTLSNMAPLDALIFEQSGLQLRIWFNDGTNGFAALDPPQDLTTTPYAAMANTVNLVSAAQLGTNPVFYGTAFADSFSSSSGLFIGGQNNTIDTGASASTIGGGSQNTMGTSSSEATIAGGQYNTIGIGGTGCTIGGGAFNSTGTSNYGVTIAGGINNSVGANNDYSIIGGGYGNQITGPSNPGYPSTSVIGGGTGNSIGSNILAVIAGGYDNNIGNGAPGYDTTAVIGGGYNNTIGNAASAAVIAGGFQNHIGDATGGYVLSAAIVGGYANLIGTNASDAFIGCGAYNQIGNGSAGYEYASAIVGGYQNAIGTNVFQSVIGGGYNNVILSNAQYATIPGGGNNVAGGIASFAAGYDAFATNNDSFVWSDGTTDTGSSVAQSVTFRASGGYRFFTGNSTSGAQLAAGAAAWSTLCDRSAKKNFQPVDTGAVLNKLLSVPVQEWNYQWEKDSDVPNIGPVAQDFKGAFYPGRDDKTITTLEFDGVELAAIQGLNRKLENRIEELEGRGRALESENAALAARLEKLEKLLAEENGGKR